MVYYGSAHKKEKEEVTIYEAIGTAWVIFTSAVASVGIFYLAFIGLKSKLTTPYASEQEAPRRVRIPGVLES